MTRTTDQIVRAGMTDRRRASRIRARSQAAIDVPVTVLRSLIAGAPPEARQVVEDALGPHTVAAVTELAAAS